MATHLMDGGPDLQGHPGDARAPIAVDHTAIYTYVSKTHLVAVHGASQPRA
jgi:site-specific recombinase XerD